LASGSGSGSGSGGGGGGTDPGLALPPGSTLEARALPAGDPRPGSPAGPTPAGASSPAQAPQLLQAALALALRGEPASATPLGSSAAACAGLCALPTRLLPGAGARAAATLRDVGGTARDLQSAERQQACLATSPGGRPGRAALRDAPEQPGQECRGGDTAGSVAQRPSGRGSTHLCVAMGVPLALSTWGPLLKLCLTACAPMLLLLAARMLAAAEPKLQALGRPTTCSCLQNDGDHASVVVVRVEGACVWIRVGGGGVRWGG
jgi:hypothetical protein